MDNKEQEKYDKLKQKIEENNPWKILEFVLDIEPEPYSRPRKSVKLESMGKNNVFYDPRSKYKRKLKKEIQSKLEELAEDFEMIEGEIYLTVEVALMSPKKFIESKNKWKLVKDRFINPIVRPDIDNWVKPVMDALNGLVYKDDSQITILLSTKVYSTLDHPYIQIWLKYRQYPVKLK